MTPGVFDCAFAGNAHPVLDLGEGLLDRIEIRRVRRQEPEPCTRRLDSVADGFGLVACQVVHDDDISRLQGRHELVLDIGQETNAVDWTIKDVRSGKPVCTQGSEKSHGAPASVRSVTAQAPAFGSPTVQRGHVGFDPGLVDEDETVRIEAVLPTLPAPAPASNVRARLLVCKHGFF